MIRPFNSGSFAATGRLPGCDRLATVRWIDGELRGDREAIGMLRAFARDMEGHAVGPISGPYTYTNHLASGLSAVTLLTELFTNPTWSGDVPHRAAPPINDGRLD